MFRMIDDDLPSSIEGKMGQVRYTIKAMFIFTELPTTDKKQMVKSSENGLIYARKGFTVVENIDLNELTQVRYFLFCFF